MSVSVSHFILYIYQPSEIAQKWFCFQNLGMNLSFQGSRLSNGFRYINQQPSLIFGTPYTGGLNEFP